MLDHFLPLQFSLAKPHPVTCRSLIMNVYWLFAFKQRNYHVCVGLQSGHSDLKKRLFKFLEGWSSFRAPWMIIMITMSIYSCSPPPFYWYCDNCEKLPPNLASVIQFSKGIVMLLHVLYAEHPESFHRASLVLHFVLLQPYSRTDQIYGYIKIVLIAEGWRPVGRWIQCTSRDSRDLSLPLDPD